MNQQFANYPNYMVQSGQQSPYYYNIVNSPSSYQNNQIHQQNFHGTQQNFHQMNFEMEQPSTQNLRKYDKAAFTRSTPQFFPKHEQNQVVEKDKINTISKIYNNQRKTDNKRIQRKHPDSVDKRLSPTSRMSYENAGSPAQFFGSGVGVGVGVQPNQANIHKYSRSNYLKGYQAQKNSNNISNINNINDQNIVNNNYQNINTYNKYINRNQFNNNTQQQQSNIGYMQLMRNSYRDNNSQNRKAEKVSLINSIYNKDYGRKSSNNKLPKKIEKKQSQTNINDIDSNNNNQREKKSRKTLYNTQQFQPYRSETDFNKKIYKRIPNVPSYTPSQTKHNDFTPKNYLQINKNLAKGIGNAQEQNKKNMIASDDGQDNNQKNQMKVTKFQDLKRKSMDQNRTKNTSNQKQQNEQFNKIQKVKKEQQEIVKQLTLKEKTQNNQSNTTNAQTYQKNSSLPVKIYEKYPSKKENEENQHQQIDTKNNTIKGERKSSFVANLNNSNSQNNSKFNYNEESFEDDEIQTPQSQQQQNQQQQQQHQFMQNQLQNQNISKNSNYEYDYDYDYEDDDHQEEDDEEDNNYKQTYEEDNEQQQQQQQEYEQQMEQQIPKELMESVAKIASNRPKTSEGGRRRVKRIQKKQQQQQEDDVQQQQQNNKQQSQEQEQDSCKNNVIPNSEHNLLANTVPRNISQSKKQFYNTDQQFYKNNNNRNEFGEFNEYDEYQCGLEFQIIEEEEFQINNVDPENLDNNDQSNEQSQINKQNQQQQEQQQHNEQIEQTLNINNSRSYTSSNKLRKKQDMSNKIIIRHNKSAYGHKKNIKKDSTNNQNTGSSQNNINNAQAVQGSSLTSDFLNLFA